jgi:hypothetical protein
MRNRWRSGKEVRLRIEIDVLQHFDDGDERRKGI